MDRKIIQEKRYERSLPLALFASLAGISVMELWRIETEPEYPVSQKTMDRILSLLLDEASPRRERIGVTA